MGLDINFYKANKIAVEQNQERVDELNKLINDEYKKENCDFDKVETYHKELDEIDPWSEIAYFRKVNLLLPFFGYEDNCSDLDIDKCQIEDLIDACKEVLADHSKAEELLPTEPGFFFGSTEYDDYYFEDVQDVLDKFTNILDNLDENDIVKMYCWW